MGKPGKNRRGKSDPEVAEKRCKALRLRKAGLGYEAIAQKVGYSNPGSAYKAVQQALKATLREPADDVRILEAERLDRLMLGLWKQASGGDTDAVDRVLRIMDRRARLLGLDAPPKAPIPPQPGTGPPDDAPRSPDNKPIPV